MGTLSKKIRKHEREQQGQPQLCGHISLATLARMRKELGDGPMRFAPKFKERTITEQIKALPQEQRFVLESVKLKWQLKNPAEPFTDDMYLRFCRCSPGEPFNDKNALKVMKKYERRYQYLAARKMKEQLLSKAIFPIPKLTTIEGHEVLYMRPGIHGSSNNNNNNKTEKYEQVITDNLVYTVNCMMECEDPCTDGIACIANMSDWTATGFATDTCFQFMSLLQNKVPVRVNVFLIVNPPKSFGRIWNLTKPLLEKSFREKVKIVQNMDHLSKYLMAGYLELLPDDFEGVGLANTTTMVQDYVTYRIAVEHEQGHGLEASSSSSGLATTSSTTSLSSRIPRRGGRTPWATSTSNNNNTTSDRSVCSTASHLQRRAQRRCSDFGPSGISSCGSSVCSTGTPGQGRNGSSSIHATAPAFRPPRVQRRASGSHFFTGEQQIQQQKPGDGDSSELTSCVRPPRVQRRASGSHYSTPDKDQQYTTTKQSIINKPTKFERRLSDLGARSNSSRSINSLSSNKCVTFQGETNKHPKKSEQLERRLSGLGSMTPSSSSTPSTTGKTSCEKVDLGNAPKPLLKRQQSWNTLSTDAESTLTNISH